MYLFIAFLAVPLIEIALFIQVGGAIGLWPTLTIVVLTAIAGTAMVRGQGIMTLNRLRSSFSDMQDPTEPLVHGAMILFSGALLLTPGFFTDAVGFALLVPGVRVWLFARIRARLNVQHFTAGPHAQRPHRHPHDNGVIDGEYEDVTPQSGRRPQGPSGWSKGNLPED